MGLVLCFFLSVFQADPGAVWIRGSIILCAKQEVFVVLCEGLRTNLRGILLVLLVKHIPDSGLESCRGKNHCNFP